MRREPKTDNRRTLITDDVTLVLTNLPSLQPQKDGLDDASDRNTSTDVISIITLKLLSLKKFNKELRFICRQLPELLLNFLYCDEASYITLNFP